jgi:hypothetical protein
MFVLDQDGEIRIDPGTDAVVNIDEEQGRSIAGRLVGVEQREDVTFLFSPLEKPAKPSAPGIFQVNSLQHNLYVEPSGGFRIQNLPPGKYRLGISMFNATGNSSVAYKTIEVPQAVAGQPDQDVNVGTITLHKT